MDRNRAPVAYGRLAVPLLFNGLKEPDTDHRLRALTSLCDLVHDPERLQQTINGGFLEQLVVLLKDENSSVRIKTCELLHLLSRHRNGRRALLASPLLLPLYQLLDDPSVSCRRNVQQVLNLLTLLPEGAEALLPLVPTLMLKLQQEEEEEVQVLLLSTVTCCSRWDSLPALTSDGVSLLSHKLSHSSASIRREAAAALMALSVPVDGKQQVCEGEVLPLLVNLLKDEDIEVQVNAAGVIMNTAIITAGKLQCLELDVIPALLHLLSPTPEEEEEKDEERRRRRKALTLYCLRALTALAEAPEGRRLLLNHLPLLRKRSDGTREDKDVRKAAQTAINVVTWTP